MVKNIYTSQSVSKQIGQHVSSPSDSFLILSCLISLEILIVNKTYINWKLYITNTINIPSVVEGLCKSLVGNPNMEQGDVANREFPIKIRVYLSNNCLNGGIQYFLISS